MNFSFEKSKTYLLACSFGPDSMALLDMLVQQGYKPVVCHVNYHRRTESNLEQSGLEQYCLANNLELNVLDTTGLKPSGNFQAWARNLRYSFFRECYKEYNADALLVAHQEDDHIETYLMQKARKTLLLSYGLQENTFAFGMNILRPLLAFSKISLRQYCERNRVPFSIDSSNLTDHYARNRIRHTIVEKLTFSERSSLLEEIQKVNRQNLLTVDNLKERFPNLLKISMSEVYSLSDNEFSFLLYLILRANRRYVPLNADQIRQVRAMCQSQHPNGRVSIGFAFFFERQYDTLTLKKEVSSDPYSFVLNAPGPIHTPFFTADFSQGYLQSHILKESYPLTIRPFNSGDQIRVGRLMKRINRLYIDWKLPLSLRKIWPVVVDKNGDPIYIPRYQKNPQFSSQSNFVINESFDYVQ